MVRNVYVLGDVQFQALNAWNYEIGGKFLDWFESLEVPPNTDLIQLGDMTEKDVNPGDVVRQLERFFNICSKKFTTTHVLVGNHDLRQYHGKTMVSFSFVEEKNKIEVVKDLSTIRIGNMEVLAMPFFRPKGKSLHDFYNQKTSEDYLKLASPGKTRFDLCVGHWQKQGPEGSPEWFRDGVNTDNIPANKFMLGHIHDRPDTDYVGSVWPLKISEQTTKLPRVIGIMSETDGQVSYSETEIPRFCSYETITYPNKPDDVSELTRIFTVENCKNPLIAQDFYKGLHIRSVSAPKVVDSQDTSSDSDFTFSDYIDAFKQYMAEKKPKIGRNAIKIITNSLKPAGTD